MQDFQFVGIVVPSPCQMQGVSVGKAHPMELRGRVVAFVGEGHGQQGAAWHFRVSPRFINDMAILKRESAGLVPKARATTRRASWPLTPFGCATGWRLRVRPDLPATLRAQPEPDRNGHLQPETLDPKGCGLDLSRTKEKGCGGLRPVPGSAMQERPRRRRLWSKLKATRQGSRTTLPDLTCVNHWM